jgi:hypothetical protein
LDDKLVVLVNEKGCLFFLPLNLFNLSTVSGLWDNIIQWIISFSHSNFITIGNKLWLIVGGITEFLVFGLLILVTFIGTLFLFFYE